jgi:hypothetical protein
MIYAALGLGFALGVACCLALGVYCALRLIRDYDDRTEADDDTSPYPPARDEGRGAG